MAVPFILPTVRRSSVGSFVDNPDVHCTTNVMYFVKKNNRRLEFNDTGFFVSFVSIKRRWGIATREVDWWRPCIFC
jgi:hypothetical protein